ncbi:hypothetical protein PLICRDRAFT_45637 [Plicaturopsis crispa FD-325 SS-3]|uniref:HNH nuclease domain-containing protein n=1 Tax=Plicaturopsis crispa FD-325 SS-3 TaxID=944288 RepID=A0A0C9SY69_PLICR|nr:hypothetical protein PLICRDRAFT_45637 [Plicaturopsis crispa FD-325 SS-3]
MIPARSKTTRRPPPRIYYNTTQHRNDEADYHPSPPENANTTHGVIEPTPEERANNRQRRAHRRVEAINPDGTQRCLVTNTTSTLEVIHALRYSTDEELLCILEYAWNKRKGTLNVNSRYNLTALSIDWHRLFDKDQWILLPEEKYIAAYYRDAKNPSVDAVPIGDNFPGPMESEDNMFNYTLLPRFSHAMMEKSAAELVEPFEVPSEVKKSQTEWPIAQYNYHGYPFGTLRTLRSHLQPFWVIANAGPKLDNDDGDEFSAAAIHQYNGDITRAQHTVSLLDTMIAIWRGWTEHGQEPVPLPHDYVAPSGTSSIMTRPKRARESDVDPDVFDVPPSPTPVSSSRHTSDVFGVREKRRKTKTTQI